MCLAFLKSSIGKKQIVATTGLLLIIFLIGHLAGNLLIYGGPEVFNGYAKKLASLRPGFYLIDGALFLVFLTHIWFTTLVILENIRSAGLIRYKVIKSRGEYPLATKLRVYTGFFLLLFVVWHVWDFSLSNHDGVRSLIAGKSMGLYGVVYNSFLNPIHSGLYIFAMLCIGYHLAHGVQSFMQTYGISDPEYIAMIHRVSNWFGIIIALGFSSIPVYVLMRG